MLVVAVVFYPQKLHSVVGFKLLGGVEGGLQLDLTNMSLTGPPGRDIPFTLSKQLYAPAEYWIAVEVSKRVAVMYLL